MAVETGATDAQILAAAKREWSARMGKPWDEAGALVQVVVETKYRVEASHIVQPTERIIALDDLKALRSYAKGYQTPEFMARIDALIAGDSR